MVRFSYSLVISLLMATASVEAFVPHRPVGASTFVQRTQYDTAAAPSATVVAVPANRGSVALQMNLFDRFARVAKSNINNILKNLEDPEKIMTQALEDMQVCCVFHFAMTISLFKVSRWCVWCLF